MITILDKEYNWEEVYDLPRDVEETIEKYEIGEDIVSVKITLGNEKQFKTWHEIFDHVPTDLSKGDIKCHKLMHWLTANMEVPNRKSKK